jgi:ADP-heptose:LPS heptosyltransferase
MFGHLQIYEPRERALVGVADLALTPIGWARRLRPAPTAPVRRVLLLRLERIGDLLMTLDAIEDARRLWPDAAIDLAVGSWNLPLARLIPDLDEVLTADVPWLAREKAGDSALGLLRRATGWRRRSYDLVVNLEPDIRSNALAWLSGAGRRAGYWTGGGGAFLTDAVAYDPTAHVATNGSRLIARAAGGPGTTVVARSAAGASHPRLAPPDDAVEAARGLLGDAARPFIGLHVSGGRESKQWHLDRFADVGRALHAAHGGTLVLTGSPGDRAMVDQVKARLDRLPVVDAAGALGRAPSIRAASARRTHSSTGTLPESST